MNPIRECRFTAIDFESAGTAPGQTDTPIQIGLASWSVGQSHHDPFTSYLSTDQPIQWSAQKVHGITTADLANAPSLLSLWPEIKNRLGAAVVVAHGKGTEKRFLRSFPGHGFGPWIDTLLLSRALWPQFKNHSLGTLCQALGLETSITSQVSGKSWHDALFDAVASLAILAHIIDTLQLEDQPLDALLHPDTSAWHQARRR